ncbi:MAG: TolC family protein [Elusimicrobia bacterium]|nr:TolC family protein [Elusimicrobiota bacterium]
MNLRKMSLVFMAIVLLSCFLMARISNSEENSLTLEECIETALKNNQGLKIAEQQLNSAKYSKIQAFGRFFPSLTLTGTYAKLSEVPEIKMATPQLAYYPPAAGYVITGYETSSIGFGGRESVTSRLSLTQPVFTGGKIRNSIRQAGYGYEIAKEEFRRTKNNLIFNVRKAFCSVLLAEIFVEISKEAKEVMQKHYEITQALYKEGKVSGYGVSKVKVQLVNSDTSLIKSQNNLELAKKFLFNLINQRDIEDRTITGTLEGEIEKPEDLEYYVQGALKNRPEIKQSEYQQKISKSLVKLAIAENLPNISLVGNYEYQKPYYFVDEWTGVWSGMVMLNYPILDGLGISNYGKIKSAKTIEMQTEIAKDQLEDGIKLEVEKAYLNLTESAERISAQKENVENAKENLKIAQERYRLGLMSDIEVRDTQLALTQAEVNYFQTLYDYKIAQAEIMKDIGVNPTQGGTLR